VLEPDELSALQRVVLAISTFHSDDAVLVTLGKLFAVGSPPFSTIIVVDSLGSGRIGVVANERGWPIIYENAQMNLGSAGNLARRLEIAASMDADWCFTINHDGYVDLKVVARAVAIGLSRERTGAIYPLQRYTMRENLFDAPRTELYPFAKVIENRPGEQPLPVAWGSSNMALYSLNPIRQGVRVWDDLWMGWEDLGYGGLLTRAGWRQFLSTATVIDESYEYRPVGVAGRRVHIADKPPFYSYYSIRNLILIDQRLRPGWRFRRAILAKLLKEHVLTMLSRNHKRERLALLWDGIFDGLRGISGKGPVP
jgi:hypothetical protein